MVKFQPLNLLHDFSSLGTFDVVFCRNVLIYFDQETKIDVLNRIDKVIERDGFLALGGAETVVGLTHAFKPVADKRGLYAPNPAGKSVRKLRRATWCGWCRRGAAAGARNARARCATVYGFSTIFPIARRDSTSSCARAASASGNARRDRRA